MESLHKSFAALSARRNLKLGENMAKQFKPGDTVRLKSGGPLMTIHSLQADDETARCEWLMKGVLRKANLLM